MDIIHQCLSLAPVPYLGTAFSVFRFIWSTIQQVQASKRQLEALVQSIGQLLQTLDGEYRAGRLSEGKTSTALKDLCRLLDGIAAFVQKEAAVQFLKLLFTKDQRIARIEAFHRRVGTSVAAFQIAALLDIQEWQKRNDAARMADQQALNERLLQLETNQQQMMETLHTHQRNAMAVMVSLKRRLDHHSDGDHERQFYSHTLRYLTTASGRQVEVEHWMITSYEVEFGPLIGSGGFGQVFRGTWNRTQVALKILTTEAGITPSSTSLRREIATWSLLRHPNILQFLGANELDDKPFIVMPYLRNGNARDYIQSHPGCDRLRILHHVSLGLIHLHFHKVVHGDLKALNILIDDAENAVLCDFGLSLIRADVTSRTVRAVSKGQGPVGSRNWMAPERLRGESPKKPSDIYAFGMTIYEIFANKIPLYHIDFGDFKDLVGYGDVRPERPATEDAPQLSNAMWELAEKCWAKNPEHRPIAATVCDALSIQLDIAAPIQPAPNSPAPPSNDMTARPIIGHSLDFALSTLTIRENNVAVNCAAFSLDGEYIVSGSAEGHTQVWDAQQGNSEKSPPKPNTTPIRCVAFSPYGPRIATGYSDGVVRVFNSVTGKQITAFNAGSSGLPAVWSVCLSPNGYAASGRSDGEIEIWSATSGKKQISFKGHTDRVTALAFNKGGTRLASGSHDWSVCVWDMSTYKLVQGPLRGLRDLVNFVAFSVDGANVVALSRNRDLCMWQTDTGSRISLEGQVISPVLFTPNSSFSAISPDGKWIAAVPAGHRNTVQIINSKTGMVVSTFEEHTGWVQTLSFSPDSKRVLSASLDKTIKVHTLKF